MATLTSDQLAQIRQGIAATETVNFTKSDINAAIQKVEDVFETNRIALGTAINTATSPLVLTTSQKKAVVREWCKYKFNIGG